MIHGLATHDVLAAFLRAGGPECGFGLAAWVPERPLVRLTATGTLRPDALAVVRVGGASVLLALERDLGTERGPVLAHKLEAHRVRPPPRPGPPAGGHGPRPSDQGRSPARIKYGNGAPDRIRTA